MRSHATVRAQVVVGAAQTMAGSLEPGAVAQAELAEDGVRGSRIPRLARMAGKRRRSQDAVWPLARDRVINHLRMNLVKHLLHRAAPKNAVVEERRDVIPALETERLLHSPAARRRRSGGEVMRRVVMMGAGEILI